MFRGWIVVAAVHAALFVIFGVVYSFAAFFSSLQREFGASRGDVAAVFAISGFLYCAVSVVSGQLADRFGSRPVILAGFALLAAGLAGASFAPSLMLLYLTYSLGVGLGIGFVYAPSVGAVQPWFVRRRGLASGIAVSGIGVGTLVVPFAAVLLIDLVGWRGALASMATGALVIGGLAAMFIERDPAARGLAPDGDPRPIAATNAAPRGITLREALRTRLLWLHYAGITLCSVGVFIPFVHLVPYAADHGLPETIGALLTGMIGAGSIVGRFALAGVGDRIARTTMIVLLYAALGALLVAWTASSSTTALALFAFAFGTAYGGYSATLPSLAMDAFGARNLAGIIGFLYTGFAIGNLLGPWLAGIAFDRYGSYTLPIVVGAVCMGAAVVVALLARREPIYG